MTLTHRDYVFALEFAALHFGSPNTELERFTYTVSHDLKSPLLTIRGYIVADAADGLLILAPHRDLDAWGALRPHLLDGVVDQILEDLDESRPIAEHPWKTGSAGAQWLDFGRSSSMADYHRGGPSPTRRLATKGRLDDATCEPRSTPLTAWPHPQGA